MLGRLRRRTSTSRRDRSSHMQPQSQPYTADNSLDSDTRRPIDSPLSDRGVHTGWSSRPRILARNSSSYDNKASRLFRRRGTDIADENDNPARMTPTSSSKSQLSAPWQSSVGSLFFRPKLANAKQHATHIGSQHARTQSTASPTYRQLNVRRSQSNGQLNNAAAAAAAGLVASANGSTAAASPPPPPPMTKDDADELHRILAAAGERPSMGNQRAQGGPVVSPPPFSRFTAQGEYENNSYLCDSLFDGQSKGLGITLASGGDSNRQRMRRYETPPQSPTFAPPPPPRSRNVSSPRMRTKSREPSPGPGAGGDAQNTALNHETRSASASPSSHRKPIPPLSRSQSQEEYEDQGSRNALQMAANAASGGTSSGASSIAYYPSPQNSRRADSSSKSTSSQHMEVLKPSDFSSPNSSSSSTSRMGQTSPTRRRGLSAGAKTPNINAPQAPLNRKISLPNEKMARNGQGDTKQQYHHQQQQQQQQQQRASPKVPSQHRSPRSPRGRSQPTSPVGAGVPSKKDAFQALHSDSTAAAPNASVNANAQDDNIDASDSLRDNRPPLTRANSSPPPIPEKSSSRPSSAGSINSAADEQRPPSRPDSTMRRKAPPRFELGALPPHQLRNASSSQFRQSGGERSFDSDKTPTAERLLSFSPVGTGASTAGGASGPGPGAGAGSGSGAGPVVGVSAGVAGAAAMAMTRPSNRRYPSYERKRGLLLRQEAHERRLVVLVKRYNAKVQEACNVIVEASLKAEQRDRRRSVSLSLRPSNVDMQPHSSPQQQSQGSPGEGECEFPPMSSLPTPPAPPAPAPTKDATTNLDRAELPSPILHSLRARREETIGDLHNLSFEKRSELLPCLLAHLVHKHFHQEVVKAFCYGADAKSNASALQLVDSLQSQVALPMLHRLSTHLYAVLSTTTNTSTSQKQTQSTTLSHLQSHLSTLIYWAGLCKRKSDAAMFIARAYGRLRDALGVLAEVVRCARGDPASSQEGAAPMEKNSSSAAGGSGGGAGGVRWYEVREGVCEEDPSTAMGSAPPSATTTTASSQSHMPDDSLQQTNSSVGTHNEQGEDVTPSTAPTSSSSATSSTNPSSSPLVGLTTHLLLTVIKVPSSSSFSSSGSAVRARSSTSSAGFNGRIVPTSSSTSSRQNMYDDESDSDADDEVAYSGNGVPPQQQQPAPSNYANSYTISYTDTNAYDVDGPGSQSHSQSHFSDDTLSASSSLSQDESELSGAGESDSEPEPEGHVIAEDFAREGGTGGGQRSMPAAAPPPTTTLSANQEPEQQSSAGHLTYQDYVERGARVVLG